MRKKQIAAATLGTYAERPATLGGPARAPLAPSAGSWHTAPEFIFFFHAVPSAEQFLHVVHVIFCPKTYVPWTILRLPDGASPMPHNRATNWLSHTRPCSSLCSYSQRAPVLRGFPWRYGARARAQARPPPPLRQPRGQRNCRAQRVVRAICCALLTPHACADKRCARRPVAHPLAEVSPTPTSTRTRLPQRPRMHARVLSQLLGGCCFARLARPRVCP